MEVFQATWWLYRNAFLRSAMLLASNWTVVFAPLVYGLIVSLAAVLLSPFGLIGGMALTAVMAACASSGLHLLENIVRGGKIDRQDFSRGFSIYLWEILGIAFILWIPMMLLSQVAYATPQGAAIVLLMRLVVYVLLNAVPELIYQSRMSGLALMSASYEFIVANWLEWFLPNILLALLGYVLIVWLDALTVYLPFFLQWFLMASVFGLCLTLLMIFRGVLFAELNGTTRRSRLFRYRSRAL